MDSDLIDEALEEKANADAKVERLRTELAAATQEANEWAVFLKKAESLVGNSRSKNAARAAVAKALNRKRTPGKLTIKKDSLIADAVQIIKDRGPMSLKQLEVEL